jgi:hypothetical protein
MTPAPMPGSFIAVKEMHTLEPIPKFAENEFNAMTFFSLNVC